MRSQQCSSRSLGRNSSERVGNKIRGNIVVYHGRGSMSNLLVGARVPLPEDEPADDESRSFNRLRGRYWSSFPRKALMHTSGHYEAADRGHGRMHETADL